MKKETAYQRRGCSIFCKILHSLLLVLLAEVLLLIFAISTSRVTSQLNENAEDILDKQVENRANYLRQNLIQAQDLNAISGTIDGVTRELVDQGVVDLNTLDTSSEEALPLLQAIVPELVSTLRTKPVNGIFVILSTHDLNHRADDSYLPGLYIRDLDSSALSTDRNADLLAERGPATAFAPLGISTDKGWSPAMPYQPGGKTSFYKESFQIAYASKSKLSAEDYGRWTPATFRLKGDDRDALAYVQPLILDDGTVYGVVGVELLTSYLTTQLPSNELQNTDHGTYLLATTDADLKRDDVINVRTAFLTGEDADKNMPQTLTLYRDGMDWMFWLDGEEQYATLQQLGLYSRNAPFSGEAWLLIGTVAQNDLYRFSHSVRNLLVMAALLTAVVGLGCSVVVARQLAKPVAQLSNELGPGPEGPCQRAGVLPHGHPGAGPVCKRHRPAEPGKRGGDGAGAPPHRARARLRYPDGPVQPSGIPAGVREPVCQAGNAGPRRPADDRPGQPENHQRHLWPRLGRPVPPPDGPLPGGQYPAGHPLCPPLGR